MTEVAFHFNAPDKVGYACRLLRKAHAQGARLLVFAEEGDLAALDNALWTLVAGGFLPHAKAGDPPHVWARSPIQLTGRMAVDSTASVLVNLQQDVPDGFDRFARVIEVVTGADDDRRWARERWKFYKSNGIEPLRHDLQAARA